MDRFKFYDLWPYKIFYCPSCDWRGKIDEAHKEYSRDYFEFPCVWCGTILAYVAYPTPDDIKAAAARGHSGAIEDLEVLLSEHPDLL